MNYNGNYDLILSGCAIGLMIILVQSQTSVLKQLHFGVSNNYVNNPKY